MIQGTLIGVVAGGQALLTGIDVVTAVDGSTAGATSKKKTGKRKNRRQSIIGRILSK